MRLAHRGKIVEVLPEGHAMILANDRRRVFVHRNQIRDAGIDPKIGDPVSFNYARISPKYPGDVRAENIRNIA
jgi:hypothetical protein